MKKQLLLLSFLVSALSFAQNYQTVSSTQINYYGTVDQSYILATRTDSIELVGLDSVFYSYKTVRENDTSTSEGCLYLVGPNWYGEKVIIQADGDNLFFNKNNDSIRIETQANLNDTFLVYVYPSGLDSIYGWISAQDTLTILGDLDSIKTIDLFSTTSFNILNPQLIISKNHGIVTWFAPYSFPEPYHGPGIYLYEESFQLVGNQYPREGITKPLRGEIFDFEVGDRFIYSYSDIDINGWVGTYHYRERTILSKTPGADQVQYLVHDTIRAQYWDGYPVFTNYSGSTYLQTYTNLSQELDTLLPEEYDFTSESSWCYLGINTCGRLEESHFINSIFLTDLPAGPCIGYAGVSSGDLLTKYINGIGVLPSSGWEWGYSVQYNSYLLYYSKVDEDTCGTNSYMAVDENILTENPVKLFPNPTSGDVTILFETNPNSNYQLTLTDVTGKIIYQENVSGASISAGVILPTETFEPGIYFIILNDGANSVTTKLIKE